MCSSTQVAENLEAIRLHVSTACQAVGRDPEEITVLGASKGQSIERLKWAWEAGLKVYGENRVQEALAKMPELPADIEWHLIGPLQSNKVKKVVPAFAAVHSVDRLKIARTLDKEATRLGRRLAGFIEINLAEEDSKHGFSPTLIRSQLAELTDLETLEIVGLMAIPPLEAKPEASRAWFRQLREIRDELFSHPRWSDRPGYLSMGMSSDYHIAIEEDATHVRIGTSLFGSRGG